MRTLLAAGFALVLMAGAMGAQDKGLAPELAGPSNEAAAQGCAYEDQKTQAACNAASKEYFDYLAHSYRHRAGTFDWSLKASQYIFAMVVVLVLSGLVFAAIQFRIALHHAIRAPAAAATEKADKEASAPVATPEVQDPSAELATKMKIDAHGIEVNSSILGVIVLLISMAFFYLYAIYIYPIQEVGSSAPDAKAQAKQKPAK